MDYKKLSELQNTYPNVESYKEEGSRIALNGLYSETNKILFAKPLLDSITPVSESSFRFILKVLKNDKDENPKFFTSQKYFDDLKASIKENNPYFPLESIKREFIVSINLDETLVRYSNLKPAEEKWGVLVSKNIFLSENGVDYNELIKYVDWVVTKPNALDIDTGGVIPAEKIAVWTSSSLDTKTLTYPNINNSSGTSTQQSQLSQSDKERIKKELIEVNSVISQIQEQLKTGKFTNNDLFRKLGMITFFPLGLLLLIGNKRRKEEARQKLEEKLTEYKNKKIELEKQLNLVPTNQTVVQTPTPQTNQPQSGGSGGFLERLRERLRNQK